MQGGNSMSSNEIKKLRVAIGLSQEELAGMLYVSRDLVSKWETNKRRPSPEMLSLMSDIFNVSVDKIFPVDYCIEEELDRCISKDVNIKPEDLAKILDSFIEQLEMRERYIFISRYYYLSSISAISEEFNISENNTRVILYRIRKKLKKYFQEASK